MLRRQLAGLIVATMVVSVSFCAFCLGIAGPQEKAKNQPPTSEATKEKAKPIPQPSPEETEEREARITKMLAEYDLKPQPWPVIPDDPPPHEGAMISLPHLVEPPDLVLVEVLEALPGRPISGERLVRPDGKISIGFYGDVYVKGLTPEQVKVAIIKHLRKFLADENLGLLAPGGAMPAEIPERPPLPELPKGEGSPFDLEEKANNKTKPRSSSSRIPSIPHIRGARSAARPGTGVRVPPNSSRSRIVRVSTQNQEAPVPTQNPIVVPVGPQGKVTITVELNGPSAPAGEKPRQPPVAQEPVEWDTSDWAVVPPAASERVFVDITSYNSKNYYVLGDVLIPGKLPWTGNDTVLDALQYAGGLTSSAELKDIRLVRPGRNGRPPRVYKVDLEAIRDRGEVKSNYQIFPGDRLIVGRNAVVEKIAAMDRLDAPIETATNSIQRIASMLRTVQLVDQAKDGDMLKELVEFWAKEVARKGDLKFDENTLREALLKKLQPAITPKK